MTTKASPKTRWGISRFGGSSATLISTSLGIGLVLSVIAGLLFARLNASEQFTLVATIMSACLLPVLSAACWALLVDRDSLKGATKNPEISVESQWYDKAAIGVFQDLLIICGLGAALFSFVQVSVSLGLTLVGILLVVLADFALRYLFIKRAQS
ncbi:hypothetical protein [Arthrobacter sp. NIO-1057]|uniref:hypothetical protein n=1 Tax=Arthrobacter sp. NIO-1057 TaxID=993071 RepID=UPI00071D869D|nr:hypothetical protein [Arthrobacter sp. NIO-1057]KSU63089.1 hypothetical protein AS038_16380 [Arthrobacter sp. NIO-1057]SCC53467.1 hypothetical protein GA0061084_3352 [Arthrobacter sp. NIO-1057]